MTQPDLAARLAEPGVADAFEAVVSLMVEAASQPAESAQELESGVRAGYAFGHLHKLVGGGPEIRDALLILVRDAAGEAVKVARGRPMD